jgi:hypothetical protein
MHTTAQPIRMKEVRAARNHTSNHRLTLIEVSLRRLEE